MPALVTRKSELHIHLEQEINETKRAIYKFTTNGTTVTELRNKIVELIKKLTVEMRREIFEEEKLRKVHFVHCFLNFIHLISGNQTTTLSTVTSTSTTTTISTTSSPVQVIILVKNEHYDESDHDKHHRIKNSTKLLTILCVFYIALIFFQRKSISRYTSFKILFLLLLSFVAIFLYAFALI